jgi:serine/threonine protein kinase
VVLTAGTKVGPYEILSHLGAGGQGEVYKARDTRLNRFVAIKVLPDNLAKNSELKTRFEREAQTLASLSHPHICPVFDVGRQDGIDYLVMEYIEGETLAERLKNGRLPLDLALQIATEIADALDKAHRQGIAHRDVKPSNIMLTRAGAKLLDFGLAKRGLESNISSSVSQLPTDAGLTIQGSILGTLQYMSPEQLEGREADPRSDIFGLGATLYEMVTGAKAFEGKSQVSLMAAILEHEPRPISSLLPVSPPLLERVIRKCLAKDPDNRWQAASDLVEALDWIRGGATSPESSAPSADAGRWRVLALSAGILAVIVAIAAALMILRKPAGSPMWVSLIPPNNNFSPVPTLALSSDGKRIVFSAPNAAGANSLWLRSIDSADARELPGTVEGILPFWSPDGQSIGFFNFAEGKLERIDISGGAPQVLASAANPRGGTWGPDGTILFVPAPSSPIFKIAASGGTASPWKPIDATQQSFESPHFLPDGKHFLFFSFDTDLQKRGLYAAALDTGVVKKIPDITTKAEYANGYLFYCKGADLFAQQFDLGPLELRSESRRVVSDVGYNYGDLSNRAFTVSSGGTLAVSAQSALATSQPMWFDRSGKQLERIGDPGNYFGIAPAPDHKKVALEKIDSDGNTTIWVLEFSSGIASKLSPPNVNTPVWADNERVAYIGLDGSIQALSVASGKDQTLFPVSPDVLGAYLQSFSPDGHFLVWTKSSGGQSDPWIAALDGSQKPAPFIQTPQNEFRAQISPDGHWIAYVSNESGRDEVIVESFPQPGQRRRISSDGGAFPEWRQDGRELYYLAPSTGALRKLMAVQVEAGTTFSASRPEFLFQPPELSQNPRRGHYVPFDSGKRFLMNVVVQETRPRAITLVLNWPSLLK